jgi:hypothetical protein
MKLFYGTFFFVSLLLGVLIPATTGRTSAGHMLATSSKDWQLSFRTADHEIHGRNEQQMKELLINYLKEHRPFDLYVLSSFMPSFLVAALFCLIGWRREIYRDKAKG